MGFKTDKNLRFFFFTFGNMNNQREQNNTQKLFLLPNKKLKKINQSLNAKKKKCCFPSAFISPSHLPYIWPLGSVARLL